jgi:hypothetical protein
MFRKIPSRIGDSKGSSTPKAKRTHKRAKSFKSILLRGSSVDAKERDQSPAPSSAVGPSPSSTSISSSGHAHGLTSPHLASSKSEGGGSSGSHKALEEVSVEQQDEARLVATEEDVHALADASSMTVDEKYDAAAATTEDDGMSWSDFEDRYCGPDLQNDPLAHDFLFPDDDVSVVSEPRTQRALVSTVPVRLAPCDDLNCLIRMKQLIRTCVCVARGDGALAGTCAERADGQGI